MTEEERDWLNELLEIEEGLSSREVDFIESLSHRQTSELSGRQHDWLKRLYEQHC